MRSHRYLVVLLVAAFSAALYPQAQVNTPFAVLSVNQPYQPLIGVGPTTANVWTDSPVNVTGRGFPGTPIILLYGSYLPNAWVGFGFSIDIADRGGLYQNQQLLNGYTSTQPSAFTAPSGGNFALTGMIPSCSFNEISGTVVCNLPNAFAVSLQSITQDPTNPPFNIRSSAAANVTFNDGYNTYSLSGDASVNFVFPAGFTFPFYGVTYTRCWISANGFISFGASPDTGFPNPNLNSVRTGVPRIMSFYTDLIPQDQSTLPRIYSQFFVESGQRKIKIGHDRIHEFGASTGPHGGECIIWENGNISVFTATSQSITTINTAVGITPGNNIDSGNPPAVGQTSFGRDLSADVANAPTYLGVNRGGFELFDMGAVTPMNSIAGFLGFGYPLGVSYALDTTLPPGQNGYVIF